MVSFLYKCGPDGLLLTFGKNFMPMAPLEIYLLRKLVMSSILILPAVHPSVLSCLNIEINLKETFQWNCGH